MMREEFTSTISFSIDSCTNRNFNGLFGIENASLDAVRSCQLHLPVQRSPGPLVPVRLVGVVLVRSFAVRRVIR